MNKRRENESYGDYQARRESQNAAIKHHLKGRLIWDSLKRGRYINPLRQPICCLK